MAVASAAALMNFEIMMYSSCVWSQPPPKTAHGESSSRAGGSACAFKRSERSDSRRSERWAAPVRADDPISDDTNPGCSRGQKLEPDGADGAHGYGAGTTEAHRALVVVRLCRRSLHVIRTAIVHRHVG